MNIYSLVLILAIIAWGFVHSLLVTPATKARVNRWFGVGSERWYRLAYNIFSVITFLPILGLVAMDPGETLYVIPTPWSYLALAGQLLALAALGVGLLQTGLWTFLGFEQLLVKSEGGDAQMVTGGLYRWVRHPLYTAGLAFIWLVPVMTVNLLVLNLGLTIYLVVGAIFEEHKLVREFGDAYLAYQQDVPMLVPLVNGFPKHWTDGN
jgi:protein-S-isoprenylcysteine O-methyltransferase Ste14